MNKFPLIKFQLDNGLQVMLMEIHTAPIVSCWHWYGIGSRNEVTGKTGLSHWVEHMQFKGTSHFSASEMDHAVARIGGYWNAFTSPDWTTYFETLPSHGLDLAIQLEADRMVNSLFNPEEVETERTVILSEREGMENDPQFLLAEAVQQVSFQNHPYKNEVIGFKQDLLNLTRDDLYTHYQNFYQPGNATLCIAGDFETDQVISKLKNAYQEIESHPYQKPIPIAEEEAPPAREVELHGPGDTTFIQLAYRAPKGNSPDFFTFLILESLLTGPSSLNMFGSGNISHRTSRLYLSLVEKQIAVSVDGSLSATIDPSTFNLGITTHPEHTPEEVLAALDEQIQQLLDEPVPQTEIDKAIKQAKALFSYGSDNITNQAFWMGYASNFANYDWFRQYIPNLTNTTPQDVMQLAQRYLSPSNRIVGIYHPDGKGPHYD